jgi:DNA-directed RNA polymerase subunit RPC12/RpoP
MGGKLVYECVVCGKRFKEVEHEDVSGIMITSGICGPECSNKAREFTKEKEKKLGKKKIDG